MSSEQLARQLMSIWESGSTDAIGDLFKSDAVYDDMPNARTFHGIDEIKSYVAHVHAWASEVRIEVVKVNASESFAAAEWVMTGVQDRPIPNNLSVATGKSFQIRGATLIEVDDDKITRAADYIDVTPLLLQLGATIELPDGNKISL